MLRCASPFVVSAYAKVRLPPQGLRALPADLLRSRPIFKAIVPFLRVHQGLKGGPMISYQLSIFAENKPGRLAAVTKVLAKEKINIRATTISTSDTFGVINLIVDDPARAKDVLTKAGMTVSLCKVLAVVIPDQPGG